MNKLPQSALWYRAKRIFAIEKLGGKCVHCGNSDDRVLEIDHVLPLSKEEEKRIHAHYVFKEILEHDTPGLKYQLLCANCHKIKTIEKGEYNKAHDLPPEEVRRQVMEYVQLRKDRERLRGRKRELQR